MKNNINYNINDNAINDNAINENINFFIDLKLNVNDLINASNRLIINHEQNEEFINNNNNNNNNNKKLLIEYSNVAKDIKNKIDKLKTLLEMTTNYIQNNCKHQIEHDYIDISPDKMINISYCTICGHNFT
jgi:hypothetical protein